MNCTDAFHIRHAEDSDKEFWLSLDVHLSATEFFRNVRDKQGGVLLADGNPAAVLRYNLFWDTMPSCTLLFVESSCRRKGRGTALMKFREDEMKSLCYRLLLVSAQADKET